MWCGHEADSKHRAFAAISVTPRVARHNASAKRRIRGGRTPVRVALCMAMLSAVRRDPMMRAHYQPLRERGRLTKVALVACMRKLLTIINARRRDELRAVAAMAT